MNTTSKLVAAGLTGALAAGLIAGGIAWASAGHIAEAPPTQPVEAPAAPVPSPRLEPELATTHRASTGAPAPQELAPPAARDAYAPELEASGAIRVRRLVLATGVERHEPTGAADVFRLRAQGRLYAFVEAVNERGEPVALRVTFEPSAGESAGHVELRVPAHAARYRTWAFTRHVYEAGRWEAVVRGPDGRVLARRAFDVE